MTKINDGWFSVFHPQVPKFTFVHLLPKVAKRYSTKSAPRKPVLQVGEAEAFPSWFIKLIVFQ